MTILNAKTRRRFASEFTFTVNRISLFAVLIWENLSLSFCFCHLQSNIWNLLYRSLCWWTVWSGLQHRGVWMGWLGLCSESSRKPGWWCLGFGCLTASGGASPHKHSFPSETKCYSTHYTALSAGPQWRCHDPPVHPPRVTPEAGAAASTGGHRVSQAYSLYKSCLSYRLYMTLNICLSVILAAPKCTWK